MVVGVCGAASALETCICFIIVGPAGCFWFIGGRSFRCPVRTIVGSVLGIAVGLPTVRACGLRLSVG
jgi:hypothetical protein